MKYPKMHGPATLAAVALLTSTAGSASATTLEVGGTAQNKSVSLETSLKSGTSAILRQTDAAFIDTCTTSTMQGSTTSPFSTLHVRLAISKMTIGNCTHRSAIDQSGGLRFEHIPGTTNSTVRSDGMSWTYGSTVFGVTLNCTTNNTHFGTLMGNSSGHASLIVNAVLNCGFFVPTAKWEAAYTFTSPTGLGFVA